MKRCVAMCLSILLIVSAVLGIEPMHDVRASGVGVYTHTSASVGLSFQPNATYETGSALKDGKAIASLSTWIYLSENHAGGVILGNYKSSPSFSFEIQSNGKPYFYNSQSGEELKFSDADVDVRQNKWVHLAFTIGADESNKSSIVKCYVNGEYVSEQSTKVLLDMRQFNNYVLGGDVRINNPKYFKGKIKELALYDEVFDAEQIKVLYEEGGDELLTQPFSYYDLTNAQPYSNIPDEKGNNPFSVDYFYSEKQVPITDYAYSFAVVGDPQIVTEYDANNNTGYLKGIYDWLVRNKNEKKIQYVFGVGDVTNVNNTKQWACAQTAIQTLDNKIPYSIVRGNHDTVDPFNSYLGTDSYKNQFQTGGFYSQDNILNAWRTLKIGEIDYLMISLDWGADDSVLAWADKIITNHPTHNVIISTHAYLASTGKFYDSTMGFPPTIQDPNLNNGDDMYNELVSKHDNIVLVLSGHYPNDRIVYRTDNKTTSILVDPQGVDQNEINAGNIPAAIVTMLYFSEDGSKVQIEHYSTAKNKFFKKANEITLNVNVVDIDTCENLVKPYSARQVNNYLSKGKHPTQTGYTFSGWYTNEVCDDACMLNGQEPNGTVYALFVPEDVLSVKAQITENWLDDNTANDLTGSIRFVTTVDSLRYREVGFEISYTDAEGTPQKIVSKSEMVYEKLYEMNGANIWERTPKRTFCSKSKYFMACTMQDIELSKFKETVFTIKPYWVTMDGNKVYGKTTTKSIREGIEAIQGTNSSDYLE